MAKQLSEQTELLHKQKKRAIKKRVRLDDISIYTTADMLRIACEKEARDATKKRKILKKNIGALGNKGDNLAIVSINIISNILNIKKESQKIKINSSFIYLSNSEEEL